MSDEKFEKLDDVIVYAQENGDISSIFLWVDEYQYEGMQKADANKIISALWSVFDKVKDDEYDPNQQYLASALRVVVEWAADQDEAVDLNLHGNFDAYVSRCIENNDIAVMKEIIADKDNELEQLKHHVMENKIRTEIIQDNQDANTTRHNRVHDPLTAPE